MRRYSIHLVVAVVLVAALLLIALKKIRLAGAPVATAPPAAVETTVVGQGSLEETRAYLAQVEPWQRSRLSPRITSQVVQVTVNEGDQVHRGEVLVYLDDAELLEAAGAEHARVLESRQLAAALEATVATQEKTLRFWEQELGRDTRLAEAGAIALATADATEDRLNEARGRLQASRQSLEAAYNRVRFHEEQLDKAGVRLAFTRIECPFDAVVTRRYVDPGDLAAPGTILLEVEDQSRFMLSFDVTQNDASLLGPGTEVRLRGRPAQAGLRVFRIYPALGEHRMATVEVEAPGDGRLRSGSYVPVDIVLRSFHNAAVVADDSLIPSPEGETVVFAVEDGRTRAVPVEVLAINHGQAAISGLAPGTEVVRSTYLGWNRLASGERVVAKR